MDGSKKVVEGHIHQASENWLRRCKFILHCFAGSVEHVAFLSAEKESNDFLKQYLLISKYSKKG